MTSHPSKGLSDRANEIYMAILQAKHDGFTVRVSACGYVDLVDADGNLEPLLAVKIED